MDGWVKIFRNCNAFQMNLPKPEDDVISLLVADIYSVLPPVFHIDLRQTTQEVLREEMAAWI